jgi:hypothetical protein
MAAQVRNRRLTTQDDASDVEMSSLDDEMPAFATPAFASPAFDPTQQPAAMGSATAPRISLQPNGVRQDQGVRRDDVAGPVDDDHDEPWKFSGRQVQMMAIGTDPVS